MKKINKKFILLTTLSFALAGGVSAILASCGKTASNDKDKGFDTKPFIENANKKFIDINKGMDTVELVKKVLTSSDGINNIAPQMGNELLFNWFKNVNTSTIKSYFDDQIKESKKVLNDKKKTYKNMDAFQVNVLDPVGVTEESYIQNNLLENLKTKFIEYIFSKDYLAIKDKNNKVIKINNNSPDIKSEINKPDNVNGTNAGERNNFKFVGDAESNATDLDFAYADFISFAFDKWVETNVPVLTPSVLFKNDANPKESLLFNQDYFGAALTQDASYKFQFFKPTNQDFQNPNASMLYQTFLTNLSNNMNSNNFVDPSLGGSIDIPNNISQDSSTKLISLMSSSFETFVAPYASAVMYKFGNLGLNNKDTGVPTSQQLAPTIMENFIVKGQPNLANGEFQFPYIEANQNPFSGEYSGMKGIKDTVDFNGSPWIITRNQFGVHIIGIDRYDAIMKAGAGKNNSNEAKQAILNELKNTILWRAAQDKSYAAGNKIELQKTIKEYVTTNLSSLFLEYAIKSTSTGKNNLFTGPWMTKPFDLTTAIPQESRDLIEKANQIMSYSRLFDMKASAKTKIYSLQDDYSGIRDATQWKTFGIAGALPYTRDSNTGNFNVFNKTLNILFSTKNNAISTITDDSIISDFDNAKMEYLTALDKFMVNIKPADSTFFNKFPKVGVSQTVITNTPFVNKILILAKSSQTINDVFYDQKYKEYLGNIWDFNANKFSQTVDPIPAKPTVTEATNDFTDLNKWILSNLQKAYQSEYVTLNFTKSLSNLYYYGDWTDLSTLEALAIKWNNEIINKNRFDKTKQDFLLKWEDNYSINSFIKTISWLLTWDKDLKTFTFENFKKILTDSISVSKIGYVGWTNSSNIYADALANRKYGLTGNVQTADIEKQMKSDTNFYKFPYFLTKLNPYSYIGAPNMTDKNQIANTYFGDNDNYYSVADVSATIKNATGFLGFQSLNSSILPNTLPTDLYSGKLLSQNISNPDDNFKGSLYEYNKDGNLTNARQELVKFVDNNSSVYELGNLAAKLIDIGFNFDQAQIDQLKSVNVGVNEAGETLTIVQRKKILVDIINNKKAIPDNAFNPIRGEYLWNNKSRLGAVSTTIFNDESKQGSETQYIVSQFNNSDIDNLVLFNASKKSFLDPSKLLGLQDDTFFKALIKLALNGEVQNRSNNAWSEFFNKTQYVFYDRSLAKIFGEALVKNWKDFS